MSANDLAKKLLDAAALYTAVPSGTPPLSQDRPILLATVDPNYLGSGFPKVTFDGETAMSGKGYAYLNTPPLPGSRVALAPIGKSYVIMGTVATSALTPLQINLRPYLLNGWRWYHDIVASGVIYAPPIGYRTSTGFVLIDGLLFSPVAGVGTAAGAVIMNLPPQLRPLQEKRFVTSDSGVTGFAFIVKTTGDVVLDIAITASVPVPLTSIRYNNDAALVRTPITLAAGITQYGASPYGGNAGTAQYAQDAAGRLLYEGLVVGTTVGTVLTGAFPAGKYDSVAGALHATYELAQTGRNTRLDAGPPGNPSKMSRGYGATGTGLSLDVNDVIDSTPFTALSFTAGSNYGSGWNSAGYTVLSDGVVKLRGLIAGALSVQLPQSLAPKYQQVFVTDASDVGPGRIDITPGGLMSITSGTNSFQSLEDMCWIPTARYGALT
jgi:hypothetical protein